MFLLDSELLFLTHRLQMNGVLMLPLHTTVIEVNEKKSHLWSFNKICWHFDLFLH